MTDTATVTAQLELSLVVPGGANLPVIADVTYRSDDPWAVSVSFRNGDAGSIEWMFARQLLTDGIAGPTGLGDVRVWPSISGTERTVSIAMASPSGAALFEVERDSLIEFLTATYNVVPTGCEDEHADLDAELAMLLAG